MLAMRPRLRFWLLAAIALVVVVYYIRVGSFCIKTYRCPNGGWVTTTCNGPGPPVGCGAGGGGGGAD